MDFQKEIEYIAACMKPLAHVGKQADYIPALAEVNPDKFGICIHSLDGGIFKTGDSQDRFSTQSISKVFALACCMSIEGEKLWERVGREPSGTAFNSLIQLETEHGIPRNPFINAGAIVVTDILMDRLPDAEKQIIDFVRELSGSPDVGYNEDVARSESEHAFMNAAIANLLKHHGNIKNPISDVLNLYFKLCSIELNCEELSHAFLAFANHRKPFDYAGITLTASQVKRINAIMQTCGFYDEAGDFAYFVGLPGKSGVGGGIAAVCPLRYSVAVWSPRLNEKGNSVQGMKALEMLTTMTEESIF
ncbi:MAG: glutaminase [Prevotella sp.]|nr:glutaminase [Prevotella sp.]